MNKWLFVGGLVLIIFLGALPLILAIGAGEVANLLGCRLDEGSIHPCDYHGRDIGGDLYTFFVLGWLGIATLPLAAIAVPVWILIAIVVTFLRRRAAAKKSGT